MQPTAAANLPPPGGDMDLQTIPSMDWLFKKERIYLLAQFWQQRRKRVLGSEPISLACRNTKEALKPQDRNEVGVSAVHGERGEDYTKQATERSEDKRHLEAENENEHSLAFYSRPWPCNMCINIKQARRASDRCWMQGQLDAIERHPFARSNFPPAEIKNKRRPWTIAQTSGTRQNYNKIGNRRRVGVEEDEKELKILKEEAPISSPTSLSPPTKLLFLS
ncbi:unnamed protein product [Phaedon cochleariae]|uniref:Uncharacterized protein n=1 Tax=Phaedon cochleariae TaxID=80249 RepID=A0A9N9SCF6_PHACE|nr:unnamed protein product [Phaedon cochleariae]